MSGRLPMRLTRDLVARCHREVAEAGRRPGTSYVEEADYRPAAERLLAEKGDGPFWLFAYGSLIWKPEIRHVELRRATAIGWHRAFSMKIMSHRGTPEQPGYMMCLDPGGTCEGVVLRLPDEDLAGQMEKLLRREVSRPGGMEAIRWIRTETDQGPVTACSFYVRPDGLENYQAARPPAEVAYGLARACGHWGSGADYLYNTVTHLEELGIHDEGLWALQELVAAEIENLP